MDWTIPIKAKSLYFYNLLSNALSKSKLFNVLNQNTTSDKINKNNKYSILFFVGFPSHSTTAKNIILTNMYFRSETDKR